MDKISYEFWICRVLKNWEYKQFLKEPAVYGHFSLRSFFTLAFVFL